MTKDYPECHNYLQGLSGKLAARLHGPMSAFAKLHQESVAESALSTKTKELVALGISIAVRCDGCICYHVHGALEAGATKDEVAEVIGVAILMGGGPAMLYGSQALEAVEQFKSQRAAETAA